MLSVICFYQHSVVILQWFVKPSDVEIVLARKGLIQEDAWCGNNARKITASCLDEQVHLESCKKYFTHDGWLAVQNVVEAVKKNPTFYCGKCTCSINDDEEIPYSVTAAWCGFTLSVQT